MNIIKKKMEELKNLKLKNYQQAYLMQQVI